MNLIESIKNIVKKKTKYAAMTNGFTPFYAQYGEDAYQYEVVQQALNCIVTEIKKLNPQHVRMNGSDPVPIMDSDVQRILEMPNDRMTTADFLEKIAWTLLLNYNAFIIPVFEETRGKDGVKRRLLGLYPIQPSFVEFLEDETGCLYVKFRFPNNDYETTIPYENVIHIRHHYSVSEFMGGGKNGQPDHDAILRTLQLNEKLLDGVSKAMYGSFAVNGIIKCKTHLDKDKIDAELREFERRLAESQSGFATIDLSNDFVTVNRNISLVDADTLKFVDEKILRNFGVPLAILTGDYTTEQYNAFYQKTLEPIIISISQAFTKGIFTTRERGFGNQIQLYPKDLIFLTTDQTIEMVRLLGDSGSLYENEKRVAFGLRPLPELEGVRIMSLNYANANQNIAKAGSDGETN